MTRCSVSLVIKRNADQKHKGYLLIPVWKASTKNVRNDKYSWGWGEKRSAYALLVGMYTGATPTETYCGGYSRNLKENIYVIHYPTSGYILKGNEVIVSKRDLYSHVHCSIIHSSHVIETTIFQQVNGLKQCDVTYIGKYYLSIRKRKKSFHLWQHGWNWRALP